MPDPDPLGPTRERDPPPTAPLPTREPPISGPDPNPTRPLATAARAPGDAAARAGRSVSADADVSLPGYEILGELGRGGMGVVYRATQRGLNRPVAVKMVHGATPADAARFLVEAEAVGALDHPHVVRVHEFGEHAGRAFLAMEFLPGGNLADRLRNGGRLAPRDAAAVVAKIARGVHAAHVRGVVHRDLKPSNVLFDAAGEPRVTDFGLAKVAGRADLTTTGAVLGTPAYMSPEQARGRAKVAGPAADVYALGVILYELLAGRRPFDGDDVLAVLRLVADATPPPLRRFAPEVSDDLEAICLRCLAKDPALRYPTAAGLANDLDRSLAGMRVSARPYRPATGEPPTAWAGEAAVQTTRPILGWPRRHVRWLVGGGLVAVAFGLVLALTRPWPHDQKAASSDPMPSPADARPTSLGSVPDTPPWSGSVFLTDLAVVSKQFPFFESPPGAPPLPPGVSAPPSAPPQGGPMRVSVGGTVSAHGIFLHAAPPSQPPSRITYDLGGRFRLFSSEVGINDTSRGSVSPVVFRVSADGVLKWESHPVQQPGQTEPVRLDVTGAKALTLEVTTLGPDVGGAHGAWVEPTLTK